MNRRSDHSSLHRPRRVVGLERRRLEPFEPPHLVEEVSLDAQPAEVLEGQEPQEADRVLADHQSDEEDWAAED